MTFRGHEIWTKSGRLLKLIREQGLDLKELYATYGEITEFVGQRAFIQYAEISNNVYFLETANDFLNYVNSDMETGDMVLLNPQMQVLDTPFTIDRAIRLMSVPNGAFFQRPISSEWTVQDDPNISGANPSRFIGLTAGFGDPINVETSYGVYQGFIAFGSGGGFQVSGGNNVFVQNTTTVIDLLSGSSGNIVGDCTDMTISDSGSGNKVDTNSIT